MLYIYFKSKLILTNFFFFSSRRRHTRLQGDWSSDVCSSDLVSRVSPTHRRHPRNDLQARSFASVRFQPVGPVSPEPPPRVTLRRRVCIEKPKINQNPLRDIN